MLAFSYNYSGQLGLGDNNNRNKPTLLMKYLSIQQMACGELHTLILKESGELLAFGHNHDRQLGLCDNDNRNIPTLVMTNSSIHQIICG